MHTERARTASVSQVRGIGFYQNDDLHALTSCRAFGKTETGRNHTRIEPDKVGASQTKASQRGRNILVRLLRNFKLIAEIDAAHVFILDHVGGGAGHQNTSLVQNVRAVYDLKRFAHIVISD